MIPFNKIYNSKNELFYIQEALKSGKTSGNGKFTVKCQEFFEKKYNFLKTFLTSSCTDALEMAAILSDVQKDDEVIIPSFTFVSSALPFVRMGAKIVFADSYQNNPNIDADEIENLITPKTKVIVVVHYAGIACDMEKIMEIAAKHNIIVIEDAAQAIDSFFTFKNGKKKVLGSIGDFGAISFHDTKNVISGEGGLLIVNNQKYVQRAEIIWEKGTNRARFFRGEIDKYGWVDLGSSFLPSEITAAYLWSQLEELDEIQFKRKKLWEKYHSEFLNLKNIKVSLPEIPDYGEQNGHIFYVITKDLESRTQLIDNLKENQVHSVFHYLSLHKSEFYKNNYSGKELQNSDKFTDCLLRLPLYYDLKEEDISKIVNLGCF